MSPSPHGGRSTTRQPPHEPSSRIESDLIAWQETGEHSCLERLIVAVVPLAERMAKATLHRLGVDDPSAVDDTVSLVLDHLRRLPGSSTSERPVAPFTPRPDDRRNEGPSDSGLGYLLWLVRERASDIARSHRRRLRHATLFSLLDEQTTHRAHACTAIDGDGPSLADLCSRLHEATPRLPPRERLVIELLLEGKTQAVISHVLDVCEGTVSRLRARAIAMLRDIMAE
jgi:RNA polymerase sigma factor (sigma-70 family)